MRKLDDKKRELLITKIDDIAADFHEVLKKHGMEDFSLQALHFGGPQAGAPCGPKGSGMKYRWDCSSDPCVLVCM